MMTEQLIHASIAPGAAMDRPVERPARPWWRRRALLVGLAIMLAGVMLWRLIPAAGSTDIAGADIETGEVLDTFRVPVANLGR